MAQRTCPACFGVGYKTSYETVKDPLDGMPWTRQVQTPCGVCDRSGRVGIPDSPNKNRNVIGESSTSGTTGKQDTRTPAEKKREVEDGIAGVIVLAMWAGIAWAATILTLGPWYIPTAVALVLGAVVRWALLNPLRFVLVWIRRLLLLTVAIAMIGVAIYVLRAVANHDNGGKPGNDPPAALSR